MMHLTGAFILLALAAAAGQAADDAQALRRAHETVLAAHRTGDIDAWLNVEADTIVTGNRGELESSGLERRAGRAAFLKSTTFSSYRDLREPIVRVSDDGTLGWVIAEIELKGSRALPDGTAQGFDEVWVWVELYEKQDGRWRMVGNVSTGRRR